MFSKNGEESTTMSSGAAETVIGPTVRVEGTFSSDDNMSIEGQVQGTIETSKDVTIGSGAKIDANVKAANVSVAGEVKGNITTTGKLTLLSTAKIYGDIVTASISIETGAVLQGQCTTEATAPVEEETSEPESAEE